MLEKEFIPYEQALALKELGFDEECFSYYNKCEEIIYSSCFNKKPILLSGKKCAIPTFSQAFRFFREKYKLEIIRISPLEIITYYLAKNNVPIEQNGKIFFLNSDSVEEAELECLNKLIEIVKNDKL